MTKNDEKPVVSFYRAEKKGIPSSTPDSDLQSQLDAVTAERDNLQSQLADGKLIPADALKRITDVKGVGEKLAPEILAALTGK